jgi:DNA-binding transcriptional ArsR family regulator
MPARDKESARKSELDVGVVKAIGHPLRMQLLSRLNERVASPVELARELDESVQLVSYHVRILRDLGFVELVRTTPRRGAIEHHYRAVRRPYFSDDDYAALPPNARAALAGTVLGSILQHAVHGHENGAFEQDRVDPQMLSDNLVLDEEAWGKLAGKILELYEYTRELQAEAVPRLQDGAEEVTGRLAILLYPILEGAPGVTSVRAGRDAPANPIKKKN